MSGSKVAVSSEDPRKESSMEHMAATSWEQVRWLLRRTLVSCKQMMESSVLRHIWDVLILPTFMEERTI